MFRRIGVSTYGADGGRSGIGSYLREILLRWQARGYASSIELLLDPDELDYYRTLAPAASFRVQPRGLKKNIPGTLWHWGILPWICWRRGYQSLFLCAANRRTCWWAPCRTVGTVHDLAALRVPGKYSRLHDFYLGRILPRQISRLDRILTVSQASARDIEEFAGVPGSSIQVTPLAADLERFSPDSAERARERLQQRGRRLPDSYLFYLARLEHPGKGHIPLIRAFGSLAQSRPEPIDLVLAGGPWDRSEEILEACQQSPYRERIHWLGFVDLEEVPDLYRAARAVAFPSYYEGFGLPVLEALACHTPLACSHRASLPEVAGSAAEYFDPDRQEEIVAALERVLFCQNRRRELIEAGQQQVHKFSWEETAETTWRALTEKQEGA